MGMTAHPCPHLFLLQCPSLPCHVFVDGYDCPWCRRPRPHCRWWRLHQVLSYSLALALAWLVFAAAVAAVVASVVFIGIGIGILPMFAAAVAAIVASVVFVGVGVGVLPVFAAAAAATVASVVLVGVGSCSSSCGCHRRCLVGGSCGWCW